MPENTNLSSAPAPRQLALNILNQVEIKKGYVNILLDHQLRSTSISRDNKRLVTELCYGVTRWKRYLDWIISRHITQKTRTLPPEVRNILRLGIYQIVYMDGIPEYAAVNETVNLAIGNGFFHQRNFINAILRNVIRSKKYLASDIPQTNSVEYSGIKYSHPDWIVELYSRQFGKENTQQLLEFNNTIAPLFLCINTLKIKLEEYFQLLNSKNIAYTVSPYSPAIITLQEHIPPREIPGYAEGYFYIQDLAAALIAMSISPRPGTKVLDACAAPGGKSLLMAMSMQNKGSLYALDIHVNRLTLLKENQERLGLDIIQIHKGDTSTGLVSSLPEKYDYILIDAPCSGLGVLRKKVDARWNKQPEDLPGLVGLQSLLLNNLALYLEKNGVLVYSTCTLNPQENQKQIIKFLSKNPQFEVESLRNILPISAHSSITPEGYLLTLPFRDHLDGMFACRMKRRT